MTTDLLTPILTGSKNTHFFEGRLLTGRDLREQEAANREHRWRLGRAIGSGIIEGLEVDIEADGSDGGSPVVKVHKGMAINPKGQLLELPDDSVKVRLSRSFETPPTPADIFSDCVGPPDTKQIPNGAGIYVLAMSPASGFEEYAPKSGLQEQGIAPGCGRRYAVEGVQFRLLAFDPAAAPGISSETRSLLQTNLLHAANPAAVGEPARLSMLRNITAHLCFGTETILDGAADPLSPSNLSGSGMKSLINSQTGLTSCDIPLVILYWTLDGIAFYDHWSVRRLLHPQPAAAGWWTGTPAPDIEAMLLQLQEHMQHLTKELVKDPQQAHRPANDFFRYLPPAGLVPVVGPGSTTGFYRGDFFTGRESGTPTVIRIEDAIDLFGNAKRFSPVDLMNNDVLQLYWIKENLDAVQSGISAQGYVLFSTRAVHGFGENDDVVKTLAQTWQSYTGLLRKQVLLPKTTDDDALPVWIALHTDQQNIIQYAMGQETSAGVRRLNRASVMAVFDRLYTLQKVLADDLEMTFAGDEEVADRAQFATHLGDLLDDSLPSGAPGLKAALQADDFHGVLDAQQAINTLTSSWSGEVVSGRIQLNHVGSPDGEALVPGRAEPYRFVVAVTARTEKRTGFTLSASIVQAQSGSWGSAVEIRDPDTGTPIGSLTLNPDQEKRIDVLVAAPSDADTDEDIVLQIVAELPPPTNRQWTKEIPLRTAAESGQPIDWRLDLNALSLPGGRDDAMPGRRYEFIFTSEYLPSRAPNSTNATLTATFQFQNSTRGDWVIEIFGNPNTETGPNSGIFQYSFPLPASGFGGRERTRIRVTAPAARASSNQTCTFTVGIAAEIIDPDTGDTVQMTDVLDETYSVVVQGTS